MVFLNNDYSLPDDSARSEDLKMKCGKEKFVPELVDAFTQDLGGKAMVEDSDAVKNAIVMVYTYRKSKAKRLGATAVNVRTTLEPIRRTRSTAGVCAGLGKEPCANVVTGRD